MNQKDLKKYLKERQALTTQITNSIIQSLADRIKELPEGSDEVLGDSIFSAGSDIAGAILAILAEEEEEKEPWQ